MTLRYKSILRIVFDPISFRFFGYETLFYGLPFWLCCAAYATSVSLGATTQQANKQTSEYNSFHDIDFTTKLQQKH